MTADPWLPNVLLLGGSNSMRYTPGVRDELSGTANVYRAPDNCRSTKQTLANIETYLGDVKWDVIHFNWGMHDLTHLNAAGKAAPPPDGRHQVPLESYRSNLKKLVARLKRTGAQLVWATTMPVGSKSERRGYRRDRDVAAYNAVIKPQAEQRLTDGIHADAKGRRILARSVAGAIRDSLPPSGSDPGARRALISSIGSERATSGAGGKIATFQGKTHVVWQDATGEGYFNRVCTYDHSTGGLMERVTLNQGRDNHSRPVIAIGPKGYLHVVLSGHNSPVTYRRSLQPNDSSAWTEPEAAGSGTYPTLVCGADGTLYLTLRSSRRWNGVDLYVKSPDQPWRKQCKLVVRDPNLNGYAAFLNGLAWGPDHQTLHLVQDFYESKGSQRGVHQAVCYMQSRDGGRTWQRA
ncbi:MAG: BNR-4 repeat-containing protein, partial [Planctomycetaceae bacterium]